MAICPLSLFAGPGVIYSTHYRVKSHKETRVPGILQRSEISCSGRSAREGGCGTVGGGGMVLEDRAKASLFFRLFPCKIVSEKRAKEEQTVWWDYFLCCFMYGLDSL